MQSFYLTFLRKMCFLFQMVQKVTEFDFFRIKTQNRSNVANIREILGFYSERFKFCDRLNHLDQKNSFYVKMSDRNFPSSAHELSEVINII